MKNLILVLFVSLLHENPKDDKQGRVLVAKYCVSCHSYTETRSVFRPSIFEMSEMKSGFKPLYKKALKDSKHRKLFVDVSEEERRVIYDYIITQSRLIEDKRK